MNIKAILGTMDGPLPEALAPPSTPSQSPPQNLLAETNNKDVDTMEVPVRLRLAASETKTPFVDPSNRCQRFLAELTHNPFYPVEVTGDVIHGPDSFGRTGPIPLLCKTLLMGASIALVVMGRNQDTQYLYDSWANLTLILSTVYLCSSWFHTVHGSFSIQQADEITFLQKCSWALFAIASPSEIIFFLVYFAKVFLVFDDKEEDINSYVDDGNATNWRPLAGVHALAMVMVLVDGLIINRIPVRLLHIAVHGIYTGCHLVWGIFWRSFDVIGDHEEEAIMGLIIFFIMTPVAFAIVYGLSLPYRRYTYSLNQRFDGLDAKDYVMV